LNHAGFRHFLDRPAHSVFEHSSFILHRSLPDPTGHLLDPERTSFFRLPAIAPQTVTASNHYVYVPNSPTIPVENMFFTAAADLPIENEAGMHPASTAWNRDAADYVIRPRSPLEPFPLTNPGAQLKMLRKFRMPFQHDQLTGLFAVERQLGRATCRKCQP
jgi:hypothetical protein